MKVDARWLDHATRLHYCKQIQCALKSDYSVAFEILLKKLQVEDTEAYHDMMRINHETF